MPHGAGGREAAGGGRGARLELALWVALAAVLLGANLGGRYLWQDEAACAVLAERWWELGAPLAYADGNLITMDTTSPAELAGLGERTRDAESAVRYFAERGDYRADDTAWTGQPWGQFAFAALGLELFGHGTLPARLPFAAAGVLTVVLLYRVGRRLAREGPTATLACALLLGNVFWLLHTRQCRYYGTATLFGLATFAAYLRWREGGRLGAPLFALSAWAWFQNDFGSLWPALGIFLADGLRERGRRAKTLAVFAALALAVAPFVLHYELLGRLKPTQTPWDERLAGLVWLTDRYQLPLLLYGGALVFWWLDRGRRPAGEQRTLGLALALVPAQLLWMSLIVPATFYRYVVDLTPLSCLIVGWLFVRLGALTLASDGLVAAGRAVACAVQILTPWFALPTSSLFAPPYRPLDPGPALWRRELSALAHDLTQEGPDPNRAVIEYLRPRLRPGDEVLINYEDIPLMFYLDVRVRGGIGCFRVEDPSHPPRFCVLRSSARFVPPAPYQRELERHRWREHRGVAPDLAFGNNPDPRFHASLAPPDVPPLLFLERVE